MSTGAVARDEGIDLPSRVVGRYGNPAAGPKMVVTGGLHGNEPAGVEAVKRVLAHLERTRVPMRGELVGVRGNTRALAVGQRYVDRDLNRLFGEDRVAAIREAPLQSITDIEELEARELLDLLESEVSEGSGPFHFVDLHSTSAVGVPFILFGDTLRNRSLASPVPLTLVLGLEEQIDGTLLEYLSERGWITMGCEGGQHRLPSTVENHEAVLWLSLVSAGMLEEGDVPHLDQARERLVEARDGRPRVIEVRYRHPVFPGSGFRMRPGFSTLQPVEEGQLLATDASGEIRADADGWLMMPLYQGQGSDGFFFARRVRPVFLGLSAVLRRLRLEILLPALPGVSRHRDRRDTLVVDTRVARWFPLEIFHLLGFRKLRKSGAVLLVSRRREVGPGQSRLETHRR